MDPYGNYSIYMIDIFGSFEATLLAYYLGVLLVLTVGIQGTNVLDYLTGKFFDHNEEEKHEEEKTLQEE